jgi:hypothetical protein
MTEQFIVGPLLVELVAVDVPVPLPVEVPVEAVAEFVLSLLELSVAFEVSPLEQQSLSVPSDCVAVVVVIVDDAVVVLDDVAVWADELVREDAPASWVPVPCVLFPDEQPTMHSAIPTPIVATVLCMNHETISEFVPVERSHP